jgi:uncharacterized membrane protein YdjX (TVP38/TMEM64 family)
VGLPRQLFSFLGGYAFGFWFGTLLAVVGTGLGLVFSFNAARLLGRRVVAKILGRRLGRINDFLRQDPLSTTIVVRFFPVGNNLVLNILAGVSSIPLLPFLAGSLVGYTPPTAIFALFGSGVGVGTQWRVILSVCLFVVSSLLGYRLYCRYRLAPEEAPEDSSDEPTAS